MRECDCCPPSLLELESPLLRAEAGPEVGGHHLLPLLQPAVQLGRAGPPPTCISVAAQVEAAQSPARPAHTVRQLATQEWERSEASG